PHFPPTHPPLPAVSRRCPHSAPHPRHPHSFPTRRSSDLARNRDRPNQDRVDRQPDRVGWNGRLTDLAWTPRRRNRLQRRLKRKKDRKSTRLNSSHVSTSYAAFCLKKKTTNQATQRGRQLL